MWFTTQDGYFSVVKKEGTLTRPLCLRSRVRRDLERFLSVIGKEYQVEAGTGTDYEYRVYISRKDLIEYQTQNIEDLDYDNFKSSLKDAHPERLRIYMNLWSDSFGLRAVDESHEQFGSRNHLI